MIRLDDIPRDDPRECALALLADLPAGRLCLPHDRQVTLAAAIARYRVTVETLATEGELGTIAYRWGWRLFIISADMLLPAAIDVRPGRDAGSFRAGLVAGKRLAGQIAALARLSVDSEPDGVVRLLDAPGLDWSGIWIAGRIDRYLVLPSLRPTKGRRLLARLRKRALLRERSLLGVGQPEESD